MFVGVLACQSLASPPSTVTPPAGMLHSPSARMPGQDLGAGTPAPSVPIEPSGALTEADGVLPDGTTVFDDQYAGVANLKPALVRALRKAATQAAADGVELYVESGWRSRRYQEELFREAVSQYGSEEKAAQWVAIPGTSAHETGDAVDVGHSDATAWLAAHGAAYGLCQIYGNELWHYELRPAAIDHGCPPKYADATHDPRLQQ